MPLLNSADLIEDLHDTDDLLIVQDLDGVAIDLVRDPLTRRIDPGYLLAASEMAGQFAVLTNGEHEGRRGVNRLVESALAGRADPRGQGLYLPGLAAGGVQLQNRHAEVSHPGVSEREIAFLAALPSRMTTALRRRVPSVLPGLPRERLDQLLPVAVLDNPLSPTINLNTLFAEVPDQPHRQLDLQTMLMELMEEFMQEAVAAGLPDSFFLHVAPNLGVEGGRERLKPADATGVGTTDVQFMLRGAIKEVGLLVLINRHVEARTGEAPLGETFNVRTAPHTHEELLKLCCQAVPRDLMPRLVGVGDTITSHPAPDGRSWLRGGSDRGFLTLLQELGQVYDKPNRVLVVDSSGGEVDRPSMADGTLEGLSDPADPLRLDGVFPGGPADYIAFFTELAARCGRTARQG